MFDFIGDKVSIGDKVIVHAVYFGTWKDTVGTVIKKTPTGLLDVEWDGSHMRFKSNGYEYHRASGYGRTSYYLENYTKEKGIEVEHKNHKAYIADFLRKFDYDKLSYEECEQVYKLVVGFKEA